MALDPSRVASVVRKIPEGRWMSYGDVARACGGEDRHARALNQLFIRYAIPRAYRVLMTDGSISPSALGEPAGVRASLEAEGGRFDGARASRDARLRRVEAG